MFRHELRVEQDEHNFRTIDDKSPGNYPLTLATNGPITMSLSFVILKSYFDGGNQGDSRQYDVLSLAAMSGTNDLWEPFEDDWNRTLKKHHAAYLHTTYAVAREDIYEEWTEPQRDAFLADCVKVADKHCARPNIDDIPGRYGLFYVVVSFVLKDFVEYAAEHPEAPNNVNESCLRQVLAEVLPWSFEQAACDQCHFFFDQGEPFYGHLCQLLQNKNARKDATALQRIAYQTEADMKFVPALQLADLYAWGQSHRRSEWQPEWLVSLLKTWSLWSWIDKTNLHCSDENQQAVWSSWSLPKRSRTK